MKTSKRRRRRRRRRGILEQRLGARKETQRKKPWRNFVERPLPRNDRKASLWNTVGWCQRSSQNNKRSQKSNKR